jgi:hypothetical protein
MEDVAMLLEEADMDTDTTTEDVVTKAVGDEPTVLPLGLQLEVVVVETHNARGVVDEEEDVSTDTPMYPLLLKDRPEVDILVVLTQLILQMVEKCTMWIVLIPDMISQVRKRNMRRISIMRKPRMKRITRWMMKTSDMRRKLRLMEITEIQNHRRERD